MHAWRRCSFGMRWGFSVFVGWARSAHPTKLCRHAGFRRHDESVLGSCCIGLRGLCPTYDPGTSTDRSQELAQRHNANPFVFAKLQHRAVAGHNYLGMSCECTFENAIVRLVAQDMQRFPGLGHLPEF